MKPALLAFAIVSGLGCTAGDPPTYDTHETFDAKVEQYRKDYSAWLDERRARFEGWREAVFIPARERVSEDQWEQYKLDLGRECVDGATTGSDTYADCRKTLLDTLLADVDSRYETIDQYIERLGGEEPKPEYPKYNLKPSPPTEHEIQYERANQECIDSGGQWTTSMHADGPDQYHNTMHCLEMRPPANDPRWRDHLLDYRITVSHDRRSHQVVGFSRVLRDTPGEQPPDSPGEGGRD